MKNKAVRLGLYSMVLGVALRGFYSDDDVGWLIILTVGGVIFIVSEWET